MSEEQLRRGLEDELARLQRDGTLELQGVSQYTVGQHLELARTNWERAYDVVKVRPQDYDFQYKMMYEALITGSEAVVAALGYRVRGADSSHETTLRIAAHALAAKHRQEAVLLGDLKDPARSVRRRATYERYGIVGLQERDQFFGQVSAILPAIETEACQRSGAQTPRHSWQPPKL